MAKRLTGFLNNTSLEDLPSATELENLAVKSGWLHKRGGGRKSVAWKKRWFILQGQQIFYYKSEKDKKPKGVIGPLRTFKLEDGPELLDQFEFSLVPKNPGGRVYIIHANTKEDKDNWIQVIKSAIEGGAPATKQTVEIEEKLRRNCYDIPPKDLDWELGTQIVGRGASGIVSKGTWLKTTEVAIKALNNVPEFIDQQEMVSFYKEIETLSQLRHPNIVPMFGYCKKDKYLCLVTEYVRGGNLSESIHNLDIPLSFPLKLELCMSTCRGMVYLHKKQVIHRDLKPGNILVENLSEGKVKVCDFGLSTIMKGKNNAEMSTDTYGSPAYAAPELPTPDHSFEVDVFSYGVIVWEICSRKKVWEHVKHSWEIAERVAKGERMPLVEGNPLNFLISKCWDGDPKKRPTFAKIYEELEKLKATLSFENEGFYSDNSTKEEQLSLEDRILNSFGSRESMYWEEFSTTLADLFSTNPHVIEKLKFALVDQNEVVHKPHWQNFIRWFTPLSECDFYQTGKVSGQNDAVQDGYQIEEIADIVGEKWFYGFLSPQKAKEILMQKDQGSFLFRFSSSNEKCYTLSVNYGSSIPGHWRITTEKIGSAYPIFRIDGRPYNSLHHIVETHSVGGEPLSIKSNDGASRRCFLREGVDRELSAKHHGIYEDMY